MVSVWVDARLRAAIGMSAERCGVPAASPLVLYYDADAVLVPIAIKQVATRRLMDDAGVEDADLLMQ